MQNDPEITSTGKCSCLKFISSCLKATLALVLQLLLVVEQIGLDAVLFLPLIRTPCYITIESVSFRLILMKEPFKSCIFITFDENNNFVTVWWLASSCLRIFSIHNSGQHYMSQSKSPNLDRQSYKFLFFIQNMQLDSPFSVVESSSQSCPSISIATECLK